ncbi:DUF86 domain-containing protein [bacterium]|nr:DUF86 domain-containing protein [bacterium]
MVADPDERLYLWDMADSARAISGFVAGKSLAEYEADRMLRGAVERELEKMGEAARKIPSAFRETHSLIPWGKIVGLRNILAHAYGEIKDERVWKVAKTDVTALLALLEPPVARGLRPRPLVAAGAGQGADTAGPTQASPTMAVSPVAVRPAGATENLQAEPRPMEAPPPPQAARMKARARSRRRRPVKSRRAPASSATAAGAAPGRLA